MTGWRFHKHSIPSRLVLDHVYGIAVAKQIWRFRPDVVLSANAPLDAQKILLAATGLVHAKFIYWLQDILSLAMSFVLQRKAPRSARIAGAVYSWLECTLLRASDAVVSITPGFLEALDLWEVPLEKTFVIENWAPVEEVRPMLKTNAWAREQGISGKFCFMYCGTLGMKHQPELLLRLAGHFEHRTDVVVAVIADGAGVTWLRHHISAWPQSLLLLPLQPYERLSEVLATADVLVALLDNECGALAVPSKTLTYLCAGRPTLAGLPASNLAAQVIRRAGAGEVVEGTDPEAFLAAAERLYADQVLRLDYGYQARAYAERTFDVHQILEKFLAVFDFVQMNAPNRELATGLYTSRQELR